MASSASILCQYQLHTPWLFEPNTLLITLIRILVRSQAMHNEPRAEIITDGILEDSFVVSTARPKLIIWYKTQCIESLRIWAFNIPSQVLGTTHLDSSALLSSIKRFFPTVLLDPFVTPPRGSDLVPSSNARRNATVKQDPRFNWWRLANPILGLDYCVLELWREWMTDNDCLRNKAALPYMWHKRPHSGPFLARHALPVLHFGITPSKH